MADYLAADALYREKFADVLEVAQYTQIRLDFVRAWLQDNLHVSPDKFPDDEQIAAIAAVTGTVQVTARAGSGKTTTLIQRTYFLLRHCRVPPEQILLLAFNRKAALDVHRKLLAILYPSAESTIAEEMRAREKSINKAVDREVAAVDNAIRMHDVSIPSVMTFHALAYGLVNAEESLLKDSDEERDFGLSKAFQAVINNHIQDEERMPRIRALMLAHFRNDWERIEHGGFHLTDRAALIAHRRSLPRETLGGEYVKSQGEKAIANFLFEHGVPYKYERNHRWGGFNYRPDFTLFRTKKSGVVIEYFGLKGEPDYDEQSARKREYWAKKADWDFLEFQPSDIASEGVDMFRARLRAALIPLGFPCVPLSEDELWAKVNERGRAIGRFTKVVGAFIGRCRKLLMTPERLDELSASHIAMTEAEEQFIPLARQFYAEYLDALVQTNSEDFDGILQRAIKAIESGSTLVRRGQAVVCDLAHVRFLSVDEFQDFSELFYQLVRAIRQAGEGAHCFCVGDDWQAINGFAGSDLKYFRDFPKYMGPSTQLTITTNYRSGHAVVSAGNAVMDGRGEPARTSRGLADGSIMIAGMEELETTIVELRKHQGDDITPAVLRVAAKSVEAGKSVAVLYRTNSIPWFVNWDDAPDYATLMQRFLPNDRRQQISVSTAHKSKGLEWDDVIVIDAVRRSYPLVHPDWVFARVLGATIEQIEAEERRLFYVAVTRAKSSVILFTEKKNESPFLTEIEARTQVGMIDWNSYPPRDIASEFFAVSVTSRPGYRIPNESGGQDVPTYVLRDLLGASGYMYRDKGVWEKTARAEGFNIAMLGDEPWAQDAKGIDVTVRDGCDRIVGEWTVDDGVFRSVG
ncbi:UvrD-helicase domain-containing protein [Dokdonella soli]|uniref:DNA 3'-5' helicase n=2 Tax=Dokdonella soli TaxID=529810 RepID=A0ABN1ICG7_9GAMM